MDYTSDQIISKAKANEELLYSGAEDRCLYHAIRWVLSQYAAGRINSDKATALRQRFVNEWRDDRKLRDVDRDLLEQTVVRWSEVESLVTAYRKDKTIANADKVFSILYGEEKI